MLSPGGSWVPWNFVLCTASHTGPTCGGMDKGQVLPGEKGPAAHSLPSGVGEGPVVLLTNVPGSLSCSVGHPSF